jgi:geranylgeranyl diphosphate synthase, type II
MTKDRYAGAASPDPGVSSDMKNHVARVEIALRQITEEAEETLPSCLASPVGYALSTSGKRLRPVLCVEAYRGATGDHDLPDAVYRLACALEIVHTYSLVHDDLPCMDDDDLRRGRPTVHRVAGYPAAVAAGAALLPIAVRSLVSSATALGATPQESALLVTELARAAGAEGMVGGQLLDLDAEGRTVTADALEGIHRRKTGALLVASLRIGAIAGRGDADLLEGLTRYGQALGLAFQIADDLLDVEGASEDLGKTAGRDHALLKASYPSLHGVEGARALAHRLIDEAKQAIAPFRLPLLGTLADFVVDRRK